jgi:hypothetical protein
MDCPADISKKKKNFEFHIITNQKAEFHTVLCPEMIEIRAKPLAQSFGLEDGDGQVIRYVGSTKHCHHLTTETESFLRFRNKNPSIFEPVPKPQAAVA